MAITAVHDWLTTNGAFTAGVSLLKLHAPELSSADAWLFAQPESPFARKKLVAALTQLNNKATEAVLNRPMPLQQALAADVVGIRAFERGIRNEAGQDLPEDSLPHKLRPLRRQLSEMHRHLVYLRGGLTATPDGAELSAMATRIVDLRTRINAGWRVLEEWRATGHMNLPSEKAPVVGLVELMRELNSLNAQLSKAKHKKSKATPEKIAKWQARKEAIRTILNGAPETK